MTLPRRLQRRRTRGWRMPEGAVYVGRPTVFGNPYVIGVHGDRARCVELFRRTMTGLANLDLPGSTGELCAAQYLAQHRVMRHLARLRGCDLVCWCRINTPCHADVLLELANAPADGELSEGILECESAGAAASGCSLNMACLRG